MVWGFLKSLVGRPKSTPPAPTAAANQKAPDIPWIEAADNPWGVRVLDVQSVTQGMVSTSKDRQCAVNAISFGKDDGTGFIGKNPSIARTIPANLRFPIDRVLLDGALFIPSEMEHKWALYFHKCQIICVRSWTRDVQLTADVRLQGDEAEITQIQGAFTDERQPTAFTIRTMDYLLRSHALGEVYPVPLPPGVESDPFGAAMYCMSLFGNKAHVATPFEFGRQEPTLPLRTHSLMHIAVARGDLDTVAEYLDQDVPIDLLAADGLSLMHWALAVEGVSILEWLLEQGCPVDVRSEEGATPLMNAVQSGNAGQTKFLLDHGANADAEDQRGFTSLHRAAEKGYTELVKLLLDYGADPNPDAHGHTPRSFAVTREQNEIVAILDRAISK